jgi:hypothetical protein
MPGRRYKTGLRILAPGARVAIGDDRTTKMTCQGTVTAIYIRGCPPAVSGYEVSRLVEGERKCELFEEYEINSAAEGPWIQVGFKGGG